MGGNVIGLAGGSFVGYVRHIGTAVLRDKVRVCTSFEGRHGLVTAVGLLFIHDDLAGPQFPHSSKGNYIEFDSQGSAAGFRGGNTGV